MVSFRNQIFLGILLAVLVGSTLALVLVSYLPSQESPYYTWVKKGSTVSGGNCTQSFPGGLPAAEYSQKKSIVLLMQPNSTAQICVSYMVQQTDLTSPVSNPIWVQYGIWKMHFECTQTSCYGSGSPGAFTIATSPSYITIYPGNSVAKIIIVYSIKSYDNSNGLYALQYLNSCVQDIPFAVGYNASQVNASDFAGFFRPSSGCGGPHYIGYLDYLSNGNITGLTNLSYTYVPTEFNGP
jgi:hypothetical protein